MSTRIAHSQTFTNVAGIEDHAFNRKCLQNAWLFCSFSSTIAAPFSSIFGYFSGAPATARVIILQLVFEDDIPQLKCCADLVYAYKTSRCLYTTNSHTEHAALVQFVLAEVASNSNYPDTGVRTLHTPCFQRKLLSKYVQHVFAIKVSMLARAARGL